MEISMFEKQLLDMKTNLAMEKQKRKSLEKEVQDIKDKITNLTSANEILNKVSSILSQAATVSRDNARNHFEQIVTNAIQFVTQNKDYEFVIQELPNRAKPSYEFYIKSTIDGVECLQKPEDANGGGFIDIISTSLKYAYLEVFDDPQIMSSTLFYDEPAKMVSEQMSVKFAEYIKFLGDNYGRQTIMITHNDNLSNVADETFTVSKNSNGISTVTQGAITNVSQVLSDVLNLLEDEDNENKDSK